MAEHKHQQQDLRAGLQHLAHLQQGASVGPVDLIHQHQQQALVEIQALERQRLAQAMQHQVGGQLQ